MKKEYEDIITSYLGVEPIKIDSKLVSGGLRSRIYWTNIPNVIPPVDKGIKFQQILDSGIAEHEKAYCLTLRRGNARDYFKKHQSNIVYEPNPDGKYFVQNGRITIVFEKSPDKRPFTFATQVPDGRYDLRPITRNESERLQTLPDNYTKAITEAKACDCLGNGWTVDVIAHIFSHMRPYLEQTRSEWLDELLGGAL